MRNLPVFNILVQSIALVWRERGDFLRLSAIPIAALALNATILHLAQISYLFDAEVTLPDAPSFGDIHQLAERLILENSGAYAIALTFMFVGFIVLCIYSAAWHFRILKPDEGRTVREALRFDRAKTRFVLLGFLLVLIEVITHFATSVGLGVVASFMLTLGDLLPLNIILPFLVLGGYVLIAYVVMRLTMVLPAAAIGDDINLRDSWQLTQGEGLRLVGLAVLAILTAFVAMIAVAIPFALIFFVISIIAPGFLTAMFVLQLILSALMIVGATVWVTALSLCYQYFKEIGANQPNSA